MNALIPTAQATVAEWILSPCVLKEKPCSVVRAISMTGGSVPAL